MRFVVVDNDQARLQEVTGLLLTAFRGSTIHQYIDPMLSAKCVLEHEVDAVFASARMVRVDGVTLLHVLRANLPELPVFLLADNDDHREAAMAEGASGYLRRPVTAEALRDALMELLDCPAKAAGG